ncbi:MAG TPA: PEGA domain-containing protein, partial [Sandaracinaceae bacterium LLY-WYZ-13_1]|nr:PEGA domain-containing protein [Sandaracinaceae bacterium LLY-WYZ-13_1]
PDPALPRRHGAASDEAPTERVHADGTPVPVAGRAGPVPAEGDVSLEPAQINSGIIRQLMPPEADEKTPARADTDTRARAAREPTARQRLDRGGDAPPEKRPSVVAIVAVALLLLAAGAGGAYLWFTMGATATLEVHTRPEVGAIVLLDGVNRGEAPVRLEDVPPGEHEVTVIADGYQDARRTVEVDGGGHAFVEVALEPVAQPRAP